MLAEDFDSLPLEIYELIFEPLGEDHKPGLLNAYLASTRWRAATLRYILKK
jgi:hypothetical protein